MLSRSHALIGLFALFVLAGCTGSEEEGYGYGFFEVLIVSAPEATSAFEAEFHYAHDDMVFVGIEPLGDLELVDAADDGQGTLRLGIIGTGEADGDLIRVVFGSPIGTSAADSSIELASSTGLDGEDFQLDVERSTIEDNPLGSYTALGFATALSEDLAPVVLSPELVLEPDFADSPLGDVTADGEVTLADALRVFRMAHGDNGEADAYELYHGDINGDGIVDAIDARLVLQRVINPSSRPHLVIYPPYASVGEEPVVILAQNAGNLSLGAVEISRTGYAGLSHQVDQRDHGTAVLATGEPPMSGTLRFGTDFDIPRWAFLLDPTELMDLYLEMDPADLELLYTRSPTSNDRLPGTVRLSPEGEELELRGLRFRGSSSRFAPKKSFNIRFDERQDFLYGSSRMNINSMYTDPTMMRERLGMDLYRELGIPASRTRYFNLYINGVYEGLYIHIERVDMDLIAHAGLSEDGTLVRDEFRGYLSSDDRIDTQSFFGFDIDSIDAAEIEEFLESRTNQRGDPDYLALAELIRWVYHSEPGDTFANEIGDWIDVDNFLTWLAIHYLTGDTDSFGDDYWLYLDHDDPDARWKFIPWDKDLILGSATRDAAPDTSRNDFFSYEANLNDLFGNELIRYVMQTPALMEELSERMDYLMDEFITEEHLRVKSLALASLMGESSEREPGPGSFEVHPQNHFGEFGRHSEYIEVIPDFLRLRYRFLRSLISGGEGSNNEATVEMHQMKPGDRVAFIDGRGWTIAEFTLQGKAPILPVTLSVGGPENLDGIDRTWTLETGGQPLLGRLTLYYRNDVTARLGKENWYPDDEPIGNQRSLQVFQSNGEGWTALSTKVRPYTNRVDATVEVFEDSRFRILYSQ